MRRTRLFSGLAVAVLVSHLGCADNPFTPTAGGSGVIYLTKFASNAPVPYWLLVLDGGTMEVIDRIKLQAYPTGVVVTPAGQYVYVSTYQWQGQDLPTIGGLSVIKAETNEVVATIAVGQRPYYGMVTDSDGAFVYVPDPLDSILSVIKTPVFQGVTQVFSRGVNEIVATVRLPASPRGIALAPDGMHVFVALSDDHVAVIDSRTYSVVARIPVGGCPYLVGAVPAGGQVYVANFCTDDVSVIDAVTHSVIDTIDVAEHGGDGPYGLAMTPDGAYLYVSNYLSDNVSVVETATNSVVASIEVANVGLGIAMTPDGEYLYIAGGDSATCVIETATNTVVGTIVGEGQSRGVAAAPSRH
jgi:YVTN family beta-propeller protein